MSPGTMVEADGASATITGTATSAAAIASAAPAAAGTGQDAIAEGAPATAAPSAAAAALDANAAVGAPAPAALASAAGKARPATAAGKHPAVRAAAAAAAWDTTSTGPALFPSVLSASGTSLADANGFVMPRLKGFNVQPAGWAASNYAAMAAEGARITRTVVFWSDLQPAGPPASASDFSGISASYIAKLDAHIANCVANNMYTVFTFYYGPNAAPPPADTHHCPTWVTGGVSSAMTTYTVNAQSATQYLAQRYGDPADPLGAGQYTPAVIGFGINEITPDSTSGAGWLNTLISQQCNTMIPWMRAFAPDWIACISCGFGGTAPMPNAPGSGETAQTFTGVDHALLDAAGGNYMMEFHDYLMATTDGTDGRTVQGLGNNAVTIKAHNTTNSGGNNYTTYPPTVGGTLLTQATCRSDQAKYVAPYKDYCAANSVPLMLGEFGWVPVDGTVTWTGGPAFIADKMTTWAAASPAIAIQWDYGTNQVQDAYAARPSSGIGADANGWQTVTNNFFASF